MSETNILQSLYTLRDRLAEIQDFQSLRMVNMIIEECDTNSLSPRQLDVYNCTIEGLSLKQTAEKLFVCEKSVKFHITTIFKKMGVTSRAMLIAQHYKEKIKKLETELAVQKPSSMPRGK